MTLYCDSLLEKYKNCKFKVYVQNEVFEGCECLPNNQCNTKLYIKYIEGNHIKHENGKFYFTNEDLSIYDDFFGKHLFPVIGAFVESGKDVQVKGTKKVKNSIGKKISSNKFIVDTSGLPAFTNEDLQVFEYRFYLTLFKDISIKEAQYDRFELYDAKFKSSKYDLVAKMQSSDFLKSKDFKMINSLRKNTENIEIGLIMKNDPASKYICDYGKVYINMQNKITIIWH